MKKLISLAIFGLLLSTASPYVSRMAAVEKDQQDQSRVLTGRVINREEQPVAKAIVYLKNTKTLVIKTYIADNDGTYRFPALLPGVDYEVYAEFNGVRSDTKTVSSFDSRKQFNITLRLK